MIRLHWVLSLLGWSPLRRFGLSGLLGLFGWVSLAGVAAAQDAPALRVTATLQAPAEVRVGATVRLQLEVLTPTWFTQPPVLPALDIPGALVTPPQGEGELVRDSVGGVSYSGVRYTYVLSPTAAGAMQVPALAVTAKVGPGGQEASGASKPVSFSVLAQTATAGQVVAAGKMAVTQEFSMAPDPLIVGGRITRSVTQRAEGVQAMLLPAVELPDLPGFKRYPREPEVTALDDGRGGFVGGQRIDRADYVAQEAGTFRLPPLTVRWRDGAAGEPAKSELPGRAFTVAPAPVVAPPFSLAEDLARLRHGLRWVIPTVWLVAGAGLLAALGALWLTWPWWRRLAAALRVRARQAAAVRRASEAWHWRQWRREARQRPDSLGAFYRWLRVATGAQDLRAAVAPLGRGARQTATAVLQDAYGAPKPATAWRGVLAQSSIQWRQAWRGRQAPTPAHTLPRDLNPTQAGRTATAQEAQGIQ
ncbi:BatD family protein [Achromobacter marplatensis]|uniref:BatD family protein n=1 Tax=Achromobacter marplatensis TaxID=470868 RepID=UPI003D005CC9